MTEKPAEEFRGGTPVDATIFIGLDAAKDPADISDATFDAGEAALKNAV